MIGVDLAGELLDFGARMKLSPQRAREQLEGAVAVHNLLQRHGVAYLADEVGMGKTLVALGAVALFRHFQPNFRVLYLAPRENIQSKWVKELRNFAASNVRVADLRVRGLANQPARSLVECRNLNVLLHETALDPDRDFFARLTSFSLPLKRDDESWAKARDHMRTMLPWLPDEALDARNKDNLARAMCCALPVFDLVVVDEAHNLKHGFGQKVAARNRVLGLAFGHPAAVDPGGPFRSYGRRAQRVLFLSATPMEESYEQLWNQLDVFGRGADFGDLRRDDLTDDAKQKVAARFLVRRVTSLRIGDDERTKNQYRREWRRGGVIEFDQPIRIDNDRQRLTVALVQKKVTELLGSTRFNNRFQIGMLASFESFAETAKLKRQEDDGSNFDDAEQAVDVEEREGIDVRDINALAKSHLETFGRHMPHPKMDALVSSLATAWKTGHKTLVFVRRVASVKELKSKLDEAYDDWLFARLRHELPAVATELRRLEARYRSDKRDAAGKRADGSEASQVDTFFAWFFRGDGPGGVVSGASIAKRFTSQGAVLSTFFEDNYAATLLDARPGSVIAALAAALGRPEEDVRAEVNRRGARFLTGAARSPRSRRFEAAQAGAIELLHQTPGPLQEEARVIWAERFHQQSRSNREAPTDLADALELPTFFTELRGRPALRAAIWPAPGAGHGLRAAFRERELRAELLSGVVRLGHPFIDFYVMLIGRLGSLKPGREEERDGEHTDRAQIDGFLELLEQQQVRAELRNDEWGAYRELAELAENFELVIDLNLHDVRSTALSTLKRAVGTLLGEQQPIGGMSGQVNPTLVKQFRMPGYPFVLVSTDLLQEGEDLHAFCSSVHHYGISWTSSAMEQRIGRVDRVRSQTERRLTSRKEAPSDGELLQVYFPHLEDTVEVLQVRRVLVRMNTFLRLMHEGLKAPAMEDRRLDVQREMIDGEAALERITTKLVTAFPVDPGLLRGTRKTLAVTGDLAEDALRRFAKLHGLESPELPIRWESHRPGDPPEVLLGTAILSKRQQPFGLYLRTFHGRLLVRCISPVGRVQPAEQADEIKRLAKELAARVGAIEGDAFTYNLTVEEDVLLGAELHDVARVMAMVKRAVGHADEIEREMLESDRPMEEFRKDLGGEHGRRDV